MKKPSTPASKVLTRPRAVSQGQRVAAANRWRDGLNPLRGLTISRVVSLLEAAQRGQWTELQWAYSAPLLGIEASHETLLALIELRLSALSDLRGEVRIVDDPADKKLAEEQRAWLSARYERLLNLYEAIDHLELAAFRHYAHLQLQNEAGEPAFDGNVLACLPQWNFVRDGAAGDWFWNPQARTVTAQSLGEEARLDPRRDLLIVREVPRAINRVAILSRVRGALSEKDWDALIEVFGIEQPVIIGPPNVPEDKEAEYEAAAERIAQGGGGYMPNGSDAIYPNAGKKDYPFQARLDYLQKQLVLAGTGGKLTMLSDATGIGAGASPAHAETFRKIAAGAAKRISEIMQRQFDRPQLAAAFPGQPVLAFWSLGEVEEEDRMAILEEQGLLVAGGFSRDRAELEADLGYKLVPVAAPPATPGALFRARHRAAPAPTTLEKANDALVSQAVGQALQIRQDLLAPWFADLDALASNKALSREQFFQRLEDLTAQLPELLDPAAMAASRELFENLLATSVANGIAARTEARPS